MNPCYRILLIVAILSGIGCGGGNVDEGEGGGDRHGSSESAGNPYAAANTRLVTVYQKWSMRFARESVEAEKALAEGRITEEELHAMEGHWLEAQGNVQAEVAAIEIPDDANLTAIKEGTLKLLALDRQVIEADFVDALVKSARGEAKITDSPVLVDLNQQQRDLKAELIARQKDLAAERGFGLR